MENVESLLNNLTDIQEDNHVIMYVCTCTHQHALEFPGLMVSVSYGISFMQKINTACVYTNTSGEARVRSSQ